MSVAALILAAGQGTRLGGQSKAQLVLQGHTLLAHAARRVLSLTTEIVAGVSPQDLADARAGLHADGLSSIVRIIEGGRSRQETLHRLLAATDAKWVLIHEVARPFAPDEAFRAVLQVARRYGAAALARPMPMRDSIGVARNGTLVASVPRAQLVVIQTPQAYRRVDLLAAHARAVAENWQEEGTAPLALRVGLSVRLVEGTTDNLKITYPDDWEQAQVAGYDITAGSSASDSGASTPLPGLSG